MKFKWRGYDETYFWLALSPTTWFKSLDDNKFYPIKRTDKKYAKHQALFFEFARYRFDLILWRIK